MNSNVEIGLLLYFSQIEIQKWHFSGLLDQPRNFCIFHQIFDNCVGDGTVLLEYIFAPGAVIAKVHKSAQERNVGHGHFSGNDRVYNFQML